ncbi:undecaprenyl/decaprenyl-phosphate alpha-N-acetylglucosaminyl 1-phosphate transferase [Winogradskyella litoriviva]|uniref:Undecaprenyl/decaprenyl-phosphate alpha-N-acetylglucosaminyl 1-phosphate transferase n=1 Tax=Winogradskyella litoriviva TaxID=1220182 RepID=A0ABX2E423_9FLAO|nr:MraY family glycosyltransferase [Winogradskyella litoriviva]NRD23225.1 undecaprenyl/decaprenyl-phosphate alpha-N-acetylglucosaminyl 1-phosphate transferase [Winogradskyella litoriviva]
MVKELLENFNPLDYVGWLVLIAVFIALTVSFASYPAIILVALKKNLLDKSGHRSSHSGTVPNLGGIGIYLSIVVAITITGAPLETKSLFLILGGITVLFFLGLKDDILILSPRKKFIGQLLAAFLLIIFTDTRIYGFSGILGITIMPYWISVGFTLFVYLLIINAFNLIDGVDGLAGSLALMASVAFGVLFYLSKDISMVVLAASVTGALIAFLYFNLSRRRKMFMGDSGSMVLGFIIAVFTVRFIDASESSTTSLFRNSSPILVLAILFFPLLDTLRIFFIRIVIHKKSPFSADNNHLHHRFLSFGFSHIKTTIVIVAINIILIFISSFFRTIEINWQLVILLISGTILYSLYFVYDWLKN